MPENDAAAVARAQAGDAEAFRALVERHSRGIFRLAQRMTGNPHDAEDVVQETFVRAWQKLERFESRANFSTWLHRIAVNCSIDHIRSHAPRHGTDSLDDVDAQVPASTDPAPDRMAWSGEVRQRVSDAMKSLSPMERAAFAMRHFEGLSIEEIGRSLGLRTNATKHSIFRAVRKVRLALEPVLDD